MHRWENRPATCSGWDWAYVYLLCLPPVVPAFRMLLLSRGSYSDAVTATHFTAA